MAAPVPHATGAPNAPPTPSLSVEAMQASVHAYVRALNECDLDAIVALYAEGAEVEDPVGSVPQRGLAAIRAFYVRSLKLSLMVTLEGDIRAVGNEAVFAFSVSFEFNGQRTTIRPIDMFRFDSHGRIVQMRAFFGPSNISTG